MAEYFLNLANYSVGVKAGDFFREQGGDCEPWGRDWVRVEAPSFYDARLIGVKMKKDRGEQVLEIEGNPNYLDEFMESQKIKRSQGKN